MGLEEFNLRLEDMRFFRCCWRKTSCPPAELEGKSRWSSKTRYGIDNQRMFSKPGNLVRHTWKEMEVFVSE